MSEQTEPAKLTGTLKEAAEVLGVGMNRAYDLAKAGVIPTLPRGEKKKHIVRWQAFLRSLTEE